MTSVFGRSRMFCGFVGLFAATSWAGIDTPTLSLKAVKLNDVPIPATDSIVAGPGDKIECEVFISEWSPKNQKLLAFQVSVPRASFISGSRGSVKPIGWDRPILSEDDVGCGTDTDCPPEFPVCSLKLCVGPDYAPDDGVSLETDRPDWVFWCPVAGAPCSAFPAVDISGVEIRYAGLLLSSSDAVEYSIPEKYAGTLIVEVSEDACGDFSLEILPLPPASSLTDENTFPILPIETEALTIQTGACDCRGVIDSVPPNCTVDARQPNDLEGTVQTQSSMTLALDCDDASGVANVGEFTVEVFPGGFAPFILDVTSVGNEITLTLTPFPEFKWTCITFNPSGVQTCVGILPGDANSSLRTELSDIPALINCLNTPGSCTFYQCDMNRSGGCHPHDLLRLIDLLIGAGPYSAYEDEGIVNFINNPVVCPSAP